jgi:methyl-accepting chemotaxis protein
MKWFRNLRVSIKVLVCCLIFMVIITGLSGISFLNTRTTDIQFDEFYGGKFQPTIWLNKTMRNILQRRIDMIQMSISLKTKDYNEIDARMKSSTDLAAENDELWKKYESTKADENEKKTADAYRVEFLKLREINNSFYEAIKNRNSEGADRAEEIWLPQYRTMRDKLDVLIKLQDEEAQKLRSLQNASTARTYNMLLIILVLSIAVSIIITIVLARSVSGPVNKGLSFARKLAAGDFTDRIDLDQKDELGQLGKALNTAADDLEKMVADIVVGSQNLVQAIQEISAGNENLSQRTSEQASSLEEVAATIEETTASINANAENSKNANGLSVKTSTMAEEGGRVVYEAVSAINEMSEASKKIEEIISVINEIAFQTNLLALNAAVEAARAGEQGRGFAVVAGEVRNLAQRSGNAAKEIGTLIKATMIKVEKGTSLANKSGEALKEIIVSVKDVGRLVSEIDAASAEQKQGASQINVAISELDSMTQQNAGLVEETASASEEIANQAQELLSTMERFKIRQDLKSDTVEKKHKELHLHSTQKKIPPMVKKDKPDSFGGGNGKDHFETIAAAKPEKKGGEIEKILSDEGFEQF